MADVLIWGASGGIGQALVNAFHQAGWRVFAAARDELAIPDEAEFTYPFDASDEDSIAGVVTLCAHQTDGMDAVIYAAGGIIANPLDKLDRDHWHAVMDANLNGAYLAARSSLNLLNKSGHMVFIGAYVHKITLPRFGAYTTAKAGLESMVTILQKENRKLNITLVRPPAVDTPFWENVPFNLPDGALQPAQVADAILTHCQGDKGGELDL
jgi:3-oxoacyl-[acyl-carrier protein] reductase